MRHGGARRVRALLGLGLSSLRGPGVHDAGHSCSSQWPETTRLDRYGGFSELARGSPAGPCSLPPPPTPGPPHGGGEDPPAEPKLPSTREHVTTHRVTLLISGAARDGRRARPAPRVAGRTVPAAPRRVRAQRGSGQHDTRHHSRCSHGLPRGAVLVHVTGQDAEDRRAARLPRVTAELYTCTLEPALSIIHAGGRDSFPERRSDRPTASSSRVLSRHWPRPQGTPSLQPRRMGPTAR